VKYPDELKPEEDDDDAEAVTAPVLPVEKNVLDEVALL